MVSTSRPLHCLPPEDIAALVDGRLSGAEQARVVAHIADCPDCYAVLAGTVDFLDHEAEAGAEGEELPPTESILPVRPPKAGTAKPRDWGWLLKLAASVVVGVGTGWLVVGLRQMPAASVEEWVKGTPGESATPFPWTVERSADDPRATIANVPFLAGVHVVDLRLLLLRQQVKQAGETFRALAQIEPEVESYTPPTNLAELAKLEDDLEELYRELGLLADYELGKWAEAGRLAAQAKDRGHFAERSLSRRFLGWARKHLDKDETFLLPDDLGERLAELATLAPAATPDWKAMEASFTAIIRAYETYEAY